MLVPDSLSSIAASSTVASATIPKKKEIFPDFFDRCESKKKLRAERTTVALNALGCLFLTAQGNIFSKLSCVIIKENASDPGDMCLSFVNDGDVVSKMLADMSEYSYRIKEMLPADYMQEVHSLLDRATESIAQHGKLFKKIRGKGDARRECIKNKLTFKLLVKYHFYSMLYVIYVASGFNDKDGALSLLSHIRRTRKKWINILQNMDLFNGSDEKEIINRERVEGNLYLAKCYAKLGSYDMAEALILGCLADLSWTGKYIVEIELAIKSSFLTLLLHTCRLDEARQLFDEQLQGVLAASGFENDIINKWLFVLFYDSLRLETGLLQTNNILLALEQSCQSLNILDAMRGMPYSTTHAQQSNGMSSFELAKIFFKNRIIDHFLHGGADALVRQIQLLQCPSEILTNVYINEKQQCFELHFCDDFCCKFFADAASAKLKVNCGIEGNKLLVRFDELLPQRLLDLLGRKNFNVLQRRLDKLARQSAVAVTAALTTTAIDIPSSDSIPCAAVAAPAYKRKSVKEQPKKAIQLDCVAKSVLSAVSWEWIDSKDRKHIIKYDPPPAKSPVSLFGNWFGYIPHIMRSGNLSTKEWQDANDVLKRGKVVGMYGEGVKVVNRGEMGFKIKFHDKPLRIYGHRVAELTTDGQKRSLYEFDDARHKHA